jgi:hypothetical protein
MTYLNLFTTYLPTNHKNIIFDSNFQKINDLNLDKNLTSQMVCYYNNQKITQVMIDVLKSTRPKSPNNFLILFKWGFLLDFLVKNPYFSMSIVICKVKKKLYGHDNFSQEVKNLVVIVVGIYVIGLETNETFDFCP